MLLHRKIMTQNQEKSRVKGREPAQIESLIE
jgi:hypothetical protein